jgi:hypothetical protein
MRCDLKHLSTFVAVAEELNFHRAAERLTMAQPAVSRIVVELVVQILRLVPADSPGRQPESDPKQTSRKLHLL